jgi:hypothetical protein
MNSASKDCPSWPRGRFLGVVGVLFVLQVGLIYLFGDRSLPLPSSSVPSVRFGALGESVGEDHLLRQFFVGDPAVFPSPSLRGFSGRGWLAQRPLTYQAEIQLKPPVWFDLEAARLGTKYPVLPSSFSGFVLNLVARLGTNFPVFLSGSEPILSGLAEHQTRREEPLPVFLAPEIIPTQSIFRLEGSLSARLLGAMPALRTWSSEKVLKKSVVQIAVDPMGGVVAARLEGTGCGLAEADAEAVATARALRFRPSPSGGTRWGEAVFQWQTTEPAEAGPPK